MKSNTIQSVIICTIALISTAIPVVAQVFTPAPDSSLNGVGYTFMDENIYFIPKDQAFQADGKMVITGYGKASASTPNLDLIVYRLNADGTPDAGFGDNGMWSYDISGTHEAGEDIAVLPDQKILILVNENHQVFLIRLLPDGSFDPDFGLDGIQLTTAKASELMHEMIIQPDGKIVVVGSDVNQAMVSKGVIRRFNADGTPDLDFAVDGYRDITIDPSQNFKLYDVALQPDGKILATGYYGYLAASGFPVIRLNTDGSFDTGFSDDGIYVKVLGSAGKTAYAEDIAVQPDGKIVVSGSAPKTANETDITVIRLRPDGTSESVFGSFGVVRVGYTIFSSATQLLIQPDGKILLGGYCYSSDTSTIATFTRLKPNGALDPTFGFGDGKFAHFFGDNGFPVELVTGLQFDEHQKLVELLWQNNTVNLAQTAFAKGSISRYLTDITVGAHEAVYQIKSAKIWPNLITDQPITLEYSLDTPAEVTVSLFDQTGRYVCNLVPSEQKDAGFQRTNLAIPADLSVGNYNVVISTGLDYQTLPLIKIN